MLCTICLHAQDLYRITFIDKGPQEFAPGSVEFQRVLAELHPNAVARRKLVGRTDVIDQADRPIYEGYVRGLDSAGISASLPLRWRNCVVATMVESKAELCRSLWFVKSVKPVSKLSYNTALLDCRPPNPGNSANALKFLNVNALHDAGVFGGGTRVCVIDNGFNLKFMSAMQHVNVLRAYDFIYSDSVVANQTGDPSDQDGHGSLVLSSIAAWMPDSLLGVAPFAGFLLAKTEDMRFERRIEEDNLCAAIEWAERNGADVVTTSVVYFYLDSTEDKAEYRYLDGKSSFASTAVNMAAERGLLCTIATGNSGTAPRTLLIPSDADSGIAVGAMLDADSAWFASSYGPTADGRQKPDLMALGVDVFIQTAENTYKAVSGTSIATPQVAGVIALIKQLHPNASSAQIKQALYSTAQFKPSTLNKLGRGFPDALAAVLELGTAIAEPAILFADTVRMVIPVFSTVDEAVEVLVLRNATDTVRLLPSFVFEQRWYTFIIPDSLVSDAVRYIVTSTNQAGSRATYPQNLPFAKFDGRHTSIPCGMKIPFPITSVTAAAMLRPSTPLLISPNPVRDANGYVRIENVCICDGRVGTVDIVGSSGADYTSCDFVIVDNAVQVALPPNLPSGLYFLRLNQTSRVTHLQLMVMK